MEILRALPFRSVTRESAGGAVRIVKGFHHPHPVLALFDGLRARRELRALVALEEAGLPVPHPLALTRTADGFELHLAAVEDARGLSELLAEDRPPPGGWGALVARLGRLLAQLHASGWEHGDLHAGNVLVDARGKPWLVDLQRARRRTPEVARLVADVVACAAAARELLPGRTRARFVAAWRAALPAELRPALQGAALLRALEERARMLRRAKVQEGLGRWLRASSRVRRVERDGASAWMRRDLPDEALELAAERGWLVLRGRRDELRARWLGAARLHEHRLPVARPAVLVSSSTWSGRGAWAAFEPPPPDRTLPARAALLDALADRALALVGPEIVQTDAGAYLLPPHEPHGFAGE